MAEKMFAHQIAERGMSDIVRVSSAGTTGWHIGKGVDVRAGRVLRAHGYPTEHRATQFGADHFTADLIVTLARDHLRVLQKLGAGVDRIRMLRSFDPRAGLTAPDVDDPYYGSDEDFLKSFTVIQAALPGLHAWVDERLG